MDKRKRRRIVIILAVVLLIAIILIAVNLVHGQHDSKPVASDPASLDTQSAQLYSTLTNGSDTISLDSGTLAVKNVVVTGLTNTTISGASDGTVIKSSDDAQAANWDIALQLDSCDGLVLENLTFDGNKEHVAGDDQQGVVNLTISNSKNVIIRNCTFKNNYSLNIVLKGCDTVTVQNCTFLDSDCGVITMGEPTSNLVVDSNYFDGSDMSEPVSIYGSKAGWNKNITITNNVIKNHTRGSGILLRAADGVLVQNNTISNCSGGISCETVKYLLTEYNVRNVRILDNTISDCSTGMSFQNTEDAVVIGNSISSSKEFGVGFYGFSDSDFSSNQITDSNTHGNTEDSAFSIYLKSATDSTFSNNVFGSSNYLLCHFRLIDSKKNTFENNSKTDSWPMFYGDQGNSNNFNGNDS